MRKNWTSCAISVSRNDRKCKFMYFYILSKWFNIYIKKLLLVSCFYQFNDLQICAIDFWRLFWYCCQMNNILGKDISSHANNRIVNDASLNSSFIIAWYPVGKPSDLMGIFSCDQAALQMVFSVRLSVCPSVRHTFLTMFPSSYRHEIFKSYYQWRT